MTTRSSKPTERAVTLLYEHMDKASSKTRRSANTPRALPPDTQVAKFALNYLDIFGYLSKSLAGWQDISIGDIIKAIKQFQGFFGIMKSGNLCVSSLRAMQLPRCGCPDIVRPDSDYKRTRDFVNSNLPRWTKTGIFYTIQDYISNISKPDFEKMIYNSFQNWCQYVQLEIQPARGNQQADILISTGQGQQDNFDGPGGILAWAYLPDGSDNQLLMKFDAEENWLMDGTSQRGIIIGNVASHEFGHCVGLTHSKVQTALMAPYYSPGITVPQQEDDIPRLLARYGPRTNPPVQPPQPPVQPPTNNPQKVTITLEVSGTNATVISVK